MKDTLLPAIRSVQLVFHILVLSSALSFHIQILPVLLIQLEFLMHNYFKQMIILLHLILEYKFTKLSIIYLLVNWKLLQQGGYWLMQWGKLDSIRFFGRPAGGSLFLFKFVRHWVRLAGIYNLHEFLKRLSWESRTTNKTILCFILIKI